jgi:hypothetical protein
MPRLAAVNPILEQPIRAELLDLRLDQLQLPHRVNLLDHQ